MDPGPFIESKDLDSGEPYYKATAVERIVHALQHQNTFLEFIDASKGLQDRFAPYTTMNWAGQRLLAAPQDVPVGLWPHVFACVSDQRTRKIPVSLFDERCFIVPEKFRRNALYHLLLNSQHILFGYQGNKRAHSIEADN